MIVISKSMRLNPLFISLFFVFPTPSLMGNQEECSADLDCDRIWPRATCNHRRRCQCPPSQLRRKSTSRGWVCLALLDAVSSSLGPPATCPLPEGAGYATIEKDEHGRTVFCRTDGGSNVCGYGYECIEAAGQFSERWNGLCCPLAKEVVCRTLPAGNDLNGRLPRFWWNGSDCLPFFWTPEAVPDTRCANTFTTKEHCLSFCADDEMPMEVTHIHES